MSRTTRKMREDIVKEWDIGNEELEKKMIRTNKVPDGKGIVTVVGDSCKFNGNGKRKIDYWGSDDAYHETSYGKKDKKREFHRAERRFGKKMNEEGAEEFSEEEV